MSEMPNPAEDTLSAIKSRLSGPFGTFILIWLIDHPKVIAYALFDASGDSKIPQAQAKIEKISDVLSNQSWFLLYGRAALWTFAAMLLFQVFSLIWHAINEWFLYYRERITAKKNFESYIYRHFGNNTDEVITQIKANLQNASVNITPVVNWNESILPVPRDHIMGQVTQLQRSAEAAQQYLSNAFELLTDAEDGPFDVVYRSWKRKAKKKTS